MMPYSKKLSACLIGDPSSERFHSMEIYEKALTGGLAGIESIALQRHLWPPCSDIPKNKYLRALSIYWDRHIRSPSLLKPAPADIYHILDHSYAHLLSRLPARKTIVTCHDLMPLMVEGYQRSWGGKLSLASFRHSVSYLLKARHVITDSVATQKALMEMLSLPEENITVVPLGVDEIFCPGKNAPNINEPKGSGYLLQVGATAEPYKNTMNILRAFSLLLKNRGISVKLVKTGKAYTKEQQNYIENEGLAPYIRYLGFVERKELPGVFQKASVLLMPSLYEGFGMPLLEAMACGVPVVTSSRGSIPEVAGEVAVYVNPLDPMDIARGIEKVLNNRIFRQGLITKGLLRSKAFTWERTAEETFMVYRKIMDNI